MRAVEEVRQFTLEGTIMEFADWLLAQTHRDDAVGDLARDFAAPGPHDYLDAATVDDVRAELDDYDADPAVYCALGEAAAEWRMLHCSPSLADIKALVLEIRDDVKALF